jgi:hypothetical protein
MKTNLIGLAVVAAAVTSFSAFAQAPCDHEATGVNYNQADGRYEMQSTQQWIPASYQQVAVERCHEGRRHGWGNRRECRTEYENRLVPGHYQTVQQWVWVPRYNQHYSQYPSQRPPMYSQGRVGFSIGFH